MQIPEPIRLLLSDLIGALNNERLCVVPTICVATGEQRWVLCESADCADPSKISFMPIAVLLNDTLIDTMEKPDPETVRYFPIINGPPPGPEPGEHLH